MKDTDISTLKDLSSTSKISLNALKVPKDAYKISLKIISKYYNIYVY